MRKLMVNLIIAIISIQGLTVTGFAYNGSNKRIKSAINTAYPGKCLDVANGYPYIGTPIVQFSCHSGTNQRFDIQQITWGGQHIIKSRLDPNRCVGIPDNVYANNHELVRLVECRNSNGDVPLGARFYLDNINGKTRFRAVSPSNDRRNTCIDVASGLNWDSLWMQMYYCHDGGNQQWTII